MGWKNLPSWLKGGIIVFVLSILLFIFGTYSPMSLLTYPTSSLFAVYLEGKLSVGARMFLFFLFTAVMYFLVGAIIGFIVGKIRKTD